MDKWTQKELDAAVHSYVEMLEKTDDGTKFTKKSYYQALSKKFPRSEKAFEYRMQNISYVYQMLGRSWITGLKPMQNVGEQNIADIVRFIQKYDKHPVKPQKIILKKGLTKTKPPAPKVRKSKSINKSSNSRVKIDYAANQEKNSALGLAGEKLVVAYEKERLKLGKYPELAKRVIHIAKEDDSAGYDVKSFTDNGDSLYIEVKTTEKGKKSDFYISSNELKFAQEHPKKFRLYRLYGYDENSESAEIYELKLKDLEKLNFLPVSYRVSLYKKD